MALSTAKYESIHSETGADLAAIKANFDNGTHLSTINFPAESAIIYQIQKMQEELDYLRGIISTNNDKVSMTLGTSGSTALAGDTTTISTAQANAITANTAKTSMTLGTSGSTALAGDTKIPTYETSSDTNIEIGNMDFAGGKYTLPIVVTQTGTDKHGNTTTTTKTGTIPLI
tara:strand:- start:613 stop:1131 length:519 start_codon:yes stop_codon:yes gene_type:complete